jgi:hypothetical protein
LLKSCKLQRRNEKKIKIYQYYEVLRKKFMDRKQKSLFDFSHSKDYSFVLLCSALFAMPPYPFTFRLRVAPPAVQSRA